MRVRMCIELTNGRIVEGPWNEVGDSTRGTEAEYHLQVFASLKRLGDTWQPGNTVIVNEILYPVQNILCLWFEKEPAEVPF